MSTTARSHIGLVRKTNEDAYCFNEKQGYYIIADGMGGHQNGQIASQLAVDTIKNHLDDHLNLDNAFKALQDAFAEANRAVYNYQENQADGILMGTTLTVALIDAGKLYLGHVGDSRAYLLSDNRLVQLSRDHTYLAELAEQDYQTYTALLKNERIDKKNTLVRAVGPEPICVPQFLEYDMKEGDCLLLMTDGMYRYLSDEEIISAMKMDMSLEHIALHFEELALSRGGKDNATVLIYVRKTGESSCAKC